MRLLQIEAIQVKTWREATHSVIPAPQNVRGKLQQESRKNNHLGAI